MYLYGPERYIFVLGADSWKTKGKKRKHFHDVFLFWVDKDFKRQTVCAVAIELGSPRNWEEYLNKNHPPP